MSYEINNFTGEFDKTGGSGLPTTSLDTNDVPMWNGTEWVAVPEGTTFLFSIASFSDGQSSPQLIGTGEWKAIGDISFTASYTNGAATAAYITHTGWSQLDLTTPFTAVVSAEAVNYPAAGSSRAFTLHAAKGAETGTSTQTVYFYNQVHYGGSLVQTGWTSADILALTDINSSITNTNTGTWNTVALAASEYFVFACPSRLANPTNWYDHSTGFQLSLLSSTPETVSVTNANGFTEDYKVWVSNQILGAGNFQLRNS
jgi:hypothetical protein